MDTQTNSESPTLHDDDRTEVRSSPPLSRRGWGKHILLSASALGILFATGKTEDVAAAPTDPWHLGGNTVATTGAKYIGSNNSAPLIFKTARVERMRITPTGNVGIGNTNPFARLLVDNATAIAIYARHISSQGSAPAIRGDTRSTAASASGVQGVVVNTAPGADSAGVHGVNNGTNSNGAGVRGSHAGTGYGVYGSSASGER